MKNMTLADVAELCHADIIGDAKRSFSEIVTDSRRLFVPVKSLFIALKGERHNGENYVSDLYERGVRCFICSRDFCADRFPNASFAIVDSPLAALQQIAAEQRKLMGGRVLAICGSNGKTIVKEWLSQLVSDDLRSVRSPRSYNSQVGVPLSVLKVEPETELAISEA